jgi:hypothetical protein
LLSCSTETQDVQRLSFRDFAEDSAAVERVIRPLEGQEVVIRGFLYPKEGGQWILAAEPNLRSCCVGTAKNARRQFRVEFAGQVPDEAASTARSVKGYVHLADGYLRLSNAELAQ